MKQIPAKTARCLFRMTGVNVDRKAGRQQGEGRGAQTHPVYHLTLRQAVMGPS